jgi:hypothetical protein
MRKSINVESLFNSITKAKLAKGWKARFCDWLDFLSSSAIGSESWNKYESAIARELEFAKANIEFLSEEDYKWLLEQEKSPTIESKKSKKSLNIDSPEFKEALANAPFVCKTHDNSDTEVMDKFKKAATKFTATTKALTDAISKPKLTISSTESQKRFWVVQITKGKKVWYKTSSSFTDGYVPSSINDAALYYEKADAEYYAKFIKPSNKDLYKLPFPVKVTVKEVLCTESSLVLLNLLNL